MHVPCTCVAEERLAGIPCSYVGEKENPVSTSTVCEKKDTSLCKTMRSCTIQLRSNGRFKPLKDWRASRQETLDFSRPLWLGIHASHCIVNWNRWLAVGDSRVALHGVILATSEFSASGSISKLFCWQCRKVEYQIFGACMIPGSLSLPLS